MKFKRLFEDFSPSMPRWLRAFALHNDPRLNGSSPNNVENEYSGFGSYRYRDTGRDRGGSVASDIFWQGRRTGKLDFSRAEFITEEVPKRKDDPILTDPNKICFVHLKSDNDEMVWVPGRSSEFERFTLDDGKAVTMKYFNNKLLKLYGKDFCYVDVTNPRNFVADIKTTRDANKSGMDIRKRVSAGDIADASKFARKGAPDAWGGGKRNWVDKSGYTVIPSVTRYASKLNDMRYKNLATKLTNCRNSLFKLQKDFFDVNSSEVLTSDAVDTNLSEDLKNAYSAFMDGVWQLKETIKNIDAIDKASNDNMKDNYKSAAINTINNCQEYIDEAYSMLNKYLYNPIDWDENDDSIYTDMDDFE